MKFVSLRDSNGSTLVPYENTWELQKSLVEKVARGDEESTVLFVEHPSVITRGKGLQFTGVPRDRHAPAPIFSTPTETIPVIDIDRGGDLTWHGPGQFVVYPILKLDGNEAPKRDVAAALRGLEAAAISVIREFDLEGFREENEAGVWVRENGVKLKIASLGIGVRKWTTFHGLALNVVNDLAAFSAFSPCGFSSEIMTSIAALRPDKISSTDWRDDLERKFVRAFREAFPLASVFEDSAALYTISV